VEGSRTVRVGNGIINIIEVIRPRRSTQVTNIGVGPYGLLGVESGTIEGSIEPFRIPRSDSVEFELESEFFMSW